MTTTQWIIIIAFFIIGVIGCFGNFVSENQKRRVLFGFLSFISIMFLCALAIAQTAKINELLEQKRKCPEYEKVENVYRLKK